MDKIAGHLLYLKHCDWKKVNNHNKSAFDYAKQNNMIQIIKIFEDLKNNNNIHNLQKNTNKNRKRNNYK